MPWFWGDDLCNLKRTLAQPSSTLTADAAWQNVNLSMYHQAATLDSVTRQALNNIRTKRVRPSAVLSAHKEKTPVPKSGLEVSEGDQRSTTNCLPPH
jgi:hypothetical protein